MRPPPALCLVQPSTVTSLFVADEESVGAQFSGAFHKESDSSACVAEISSGVAVTLSRTESLRALVALPRY